MALNINGDFDLDTRYRFISIFAIFSLIFPFNSWLGVLIIHLVFEMISRVLLILVFSVASILTIFYFKNVRVFIDFAFLDTIFLFFSSYLFFWWCFSCLLIFVQYFPFVLYFNSFQDGLANFAYLGIIFFSFSFFSFHDVLIDFVSFFYDYPSAFILVIFFGILFDFVIFNTIILFFVAFLSIFLMF